MSEKDIQFAKLLNLLKPTEQRKAALRDFARQNANLKSPPELKELVLKRAHDILQQHDALPTPRESKGVINDAAGVTKRSRRYQGGRSYDTRVSIIETPNVSLLPFLRAIPGGSGQIGATLRETQSPSSDEIAGRQIEECSILLSAFLDDDMRAQYLPWLGAEIEIRKQPSKDGSSAEYRAVSEKSATDGDAVLAITLSTHDGRRAIAKISRTSGAADWFNGDKMPNDWYELNFKLEIAE